MRLLSTALTLLVLITVSACREDASTAVPRLTQELSSADRSVRNKAALELSHYGSEAKDAVPGLTRLLRDENGGVRTSAALALRKIDTPAARKALENEKKR